MMQSNNAPFNSFYSAFDSTGHMGLMKNFTLDMFQHSETNSIIEEQMWTKEFPSGINWRMDAFELNSGNGSGKADYFM